MVGEGGSGERPVAKQVSVGKRAMIFKSANRSGCPFTQAVSSVVYLVPIDGNTGMPRRSLVVLSGPAVLANLQVRFGGTLVAC